MQEVEFDTTVWHWHDDDDDDFQTLISVLPSNCALENGREQKKIETHNDHRLLHRH